MRNVLEETLGDNLVKEAEKQALRSSMNNFKTGAIVFDRNHKILGRGCSYAVEHSFVHAEEDALNDVHKADSFAANILVVSLGKSRNYAYSSRPCLKCVYRLAARDIFYVYFAERLSGGQWVLNIESPTELNNRAIRSDLRVTQYAKDMRIPRAVKQPATI